MKILQFRVKIFFISILYLISDSCCGGIEKMNAYLGETATFTCNYPDGFKTNSKRLTNLYDQTTVKTIIYTEKESEKEQKDRFSIFDDRRSKVFSVNISDVREDDGGVYLCAVWVWRKEKSVRYYSYFKEIQLQVTGLVFGYAGGSVILFPDLRWDLNNTRYICKMEQSGCVNITKDQTKSNAVTKGRFKMYSNAENKFTVLIRELNLQDSAMYRFGVGNEKHKDIELTVQNDVCCGGIEKTNAYLEEMATFTCNYPEEFKTNNKYLINLYDQNTVKQIIHTGKESQKEQMDRFSIFDDRRSKVFSVNISDVREDDGGVYLCGVWRKEKSVGYYSYFKEIQLQVTGLVFGYSGGSVTILSDLQWDVNNTRYICKVEEGGCLDIIKDQTKSNAVTSGRFKMYSNTADKFTVLIRELNPQDSAVYRFGVGNKQHKDIELTVQNDSCCGRIKRINANLGETATFKCNYPEELKTNSKRLINLNDQTIIKYIIHTEKESQKEQKDRFSIFDDRRSKVFSVNISDVREDDGGLYLCGVWRKDKSVGYYSYFKEIQLQVTEKSTVLPQSPSTAMEPTTATTYWTTSTEPAVTVTSDEEHLKKSTALPETPSTTMTATTYWTTSTAPAAAETSDEEHLSSSLIITVCVCVALLLIGGAALIYKLRNHIIQDSAFTYQLTEKNNQGDGDPHGNQYISMGPVHQSLDSNTK
ncbi:polymeric immunoglobulin receptor-like isoform X2 [Colossoma macropomum]|uniref:polymeric immunoglobulin receptor-like isoform X2 n=1 Tax=Colossoma macropomum TaxID=42526 RepID=UPI001864253E|nr:polymeric immunoglobulin receptor-like isoform X2 [Colossoma macropomum]